MPRRNLNILAVLAVVSMAAAPAAAAEQNADAQAYLAKALNDPARSAAALAVLQSTGDKQLIPLFEAATRSSDENCRRLATAALGELAGADAAATLLERARKDPAGPVRREATVQLARVRQIPATHLVALLRDGDETVRCLAARGLIQRGRGRLAADTLEQLASSKDLPTACLSRLSLLGMGRRKQLAPLRKLIRDTRTPHDVLLLLLQQIADEKISSAAEMAEALSNRDRPVAIRLAAYRAISAVSDVASGVLGDAIRNSQRTVFRVRLLDILASRKDAADELRALAEQDDAVGLLARFESARLDKKRQAAGPALDAVAAGHPVVINYLLSRAREDLAAKDAACDFYAPALRAYIRSLDVRTQTMQPEHVFAARAAAMLIDLGDPAGLGELKKILGGRHCALARAVAGGLLRAKSRTACELARPLLKSPYDELATDAALTLGRFGKADAVGHLRGMLAHPGRYARLELVLASWYLLKISGRAQAAAEQLAEQIR